MKRIYFDVQDLEADLYNIIDMYGKQPRVTAKIEKGVIMYTVTC